MNRELENLLKVMSTSAWCRLWRLKKLHQSVDAELSEAPDGVVLLRLSYNGELTVEHRCGARAEALALAAGRRRELEREGWTNHW